MGNSLYLVTGGAGFIGSNTVRSLLADGYRVRVFDDESTGRRKNLAELLEGDAALEWQRESLLDADAVRRAMSGVDYVIHLAALPSVARSMEDPLMSHEVNATGTLRVLTEAREAGVKRVVCASSSSVYGDSPTLPKHEGMAPSPLSPYAVSKLAGESYGRVFNASLDVEVVSLRYFNVFGPRQDPASHYAAVLPKFISAMRRGERPTIFGDGLQSRDFCFIDNVVSANRLACTAPKAAGQVFNIACGERIDLLGVVRLLNEYLGTSLEPHFGPVRAGDIKHSLAAVEHARELLGYEVLVPFAEGLRRTVDWFASGAEDEPA